MAITAGRADLADHGEYDVLGRHAERQFAFDQHQHILHFLGDQALGGEHVLDLGSANTVSQSTECAVGRGVGVAADHRHARQGGTLLRANDVDDALAHVVHLELDNAVFIAVVVEGLDLQARDLVSNRFDAALALRRGRYVMVRGRDIGIDAPRLAPGQTQAFEGLRRSHFMDDVTVDVDQRRTIVALFDQMRIPELVVERFAGHQTVSSSFVSMPRVLNDSITLWLVRSILGGYIK